MVNLYLYPKLLASFPPEEHKARNCCGNRVMSPKRWILLLIFYISYLMFGASIYYHIQHGEEKQQRAESLKERIEINEYLVDQLADKNETTQIQILDKITDYCGKPVTNYTTDQYEIPYTWTFYHSFFFAFTVCSTVGYGNISPTTFLGRMIMIAYSVIGIPVNGILFAGLGEYFGKTFEAIYRRYKKYKMSHNVHYVPPQLGLVTIIIIALIPGITLFILLPSWVFTFFEGWPYSISMYYSYVTMTTIGFGDYVPTFGSTQPREFGGWFVVYQIFVIVWFIFSLGYLLMIMTFITRGLQSKKLSYLEQQLSTNIKATQNRIWNGVTKDVGYLRRILNELYILKVKPVYTEQDASFLLYRSNSCPELSMYRVDPPPEFHRKRAFSECYDAMEARAAGTPMRASSDTELDKLDKQKSFENAEVFRQTTELLAKVVCALGTVKPLPEEDTTIGSADMYGGYHGFSDSQILASEWSYPSVNDIPKPRGRACSDFNINPKWRGARRPTMQPNEWTWSGDNNQIQEVINNRFKQGDANNLYRSSFGKPPSQDYVVNMGDEELKKPRVKKFSMPDGLRKLFPFKKRSSQEFMSATGGAVGGEVIGPAGVKSDRKYSIMSVPETHQYRAQPLDYYSTVTANASPSYFQNGKPSTAALNTGASYPSDVSITSKPSVAFSGAVSAAADAGGRRGSTMDAVGASYQRNAPAGAAAGSRKRRESIFVQNPALAGRRASMFPSRIAAAPAQRRGSLFNNTAGPNNVGGIPARRGSLFPTAGRLPMASNERRPSLFSVTSQEDRNVLENTTLADLIRALEAMHTQAVHEESVSNEPIVSRTEMGGIFGTNKKRKVGNAGLATGEAEMPTLLSLFSGDNTKTLSTAAANRLYARRATIVGTLPSTSFGTNSHQSTLTSPASNVLTRRRKSSTVQIVEPPPGYSEREAQPPTAASTQQAPQSAAASVVSKFKRRFSVRPTALQIPPGKAPPPGVNINSMLQQSSGAIAPSSQSISSQTVLQRRLSLRPSPLARELNISTIQPAGSSSSEASPISPTNSTSSTTRLLPLLTEGASKGAGNAGPAPRTSNATSSTHSPLSRIVQIAQAQRKSSMPDGAAMDRTKKPDAK